MLFSHNQPILSHNWPLELLTQREREGISHHWELCLRLPILEKSKLKRGGEKEKGVVEKLSSSQDPSSKKSKPKLSQSHPLYMNLLFKILVAMMKSRNFS